MPDAIVAALIGGFVALVVAGLANFGAEAYRRHRDAVAVAGALAGELASYAEAMQRTKVDLPTLIDMANSGQQIKAPKLPTPTSPMYEHYGKNVGLLGPHLAEEVAYVYANVQTFRAMFFSALESDDCRIQAMNFRGALSAILITEARGQRLITALRVFAAREFMTAEGPAF